MSVCPASSMAMTPISSLRSVAQPCSAMGPSRVTTRPSVRCSAVDFSNLRLPHVDVPQLDLSKLPQPDLSAIPRPDFSQMAASMPDVSQLKANVSKLRLPDVPQPDFSQIAASMPDLSKLRLPHVDIPQIDVSNLPQPDFSQIADRISDWEVWELHKITDPTTVVITVSAVVITAFAVISNIASSNKASPSSEPDSSAPATSGLDSATLSQNFQDVSENEIAKGGQPVVAAATIQQAPVAPQQQHQQQQQQQHNPQVTMGSLEAPPASSTPESPVAPPEPAPITHEVVLTYSTGWQEAFFHCNMDGKGWTEVPGLPMDSVSDNTKMIRLPCKEVEFVINNGQNNWDSIPGNYRVTAEGTYRLENGRLQRV